VWEGRLIMRLYKVMGAIGVIWVVALVAYSFHHGLGGGIGSDFHGFEDVTLEELFDALNDNELKAKDTYVGKYVRVTGVLSGIDVDGRYIDIDDGAFLTSRSICCNLVTDDVRRQVKKVKKGDEVAVRGKVVDIYEKLLSRGYTIDAHYVDAVSDGEKAGQGESDKGEPEGEDASDEVDEVPADAIVLKAGEAGEYGRYFTVYDGTSATDAGTRLGWFVPAGDYVVENLSDAGAWEQVNYGSAEPVVNADGFPETSGFQNVLVKLHETAEISVPEGGCVYIVEGTTRLALTRR
jgi:hypothetical protein